MNSILVSKAVQFHSNQINQIDDAFALAIFGIAGIIGTIFIWRFRHTPRETTA